MKEIVENLVSMTAKEIRHLSDTMKQEYGIEPAAAAVAATKTPEQLPDEKIERQYRPIVPKNIGRNYIKSRKYTKHR